MNYLPANFLVKAADDHRLLPNHLSLIMAVLFYFRTDDTPGEGTKISRSRLMRFARIKSIATYHKCLKDVIDFGYISYEPSYHPTNASSIWLLNEDEDSQ